MTTYKIERGPGIDREKAQELAKKKKWWREDLVFYPNADKRFYLWKDSKR
jgi:hypothetical protein